jgi:hypothetical protein
MQMTTRNEQAEKTSFYGIRNSIRSEIQKSGPQAVEVEDQSDGDGRADGTNGALSTTTTAPAPAPAPA